MPKETKNFQKKLDKISTKFRNNKLESNYFSQLEKLVGIIAKMGRNCSILTN